jgi:hypothetical protein
MINHNHILLGVVRTRASTYSLSPAMFVAREERLRGARKSNDNNKRTEGVLF